jgi:hypothetical protein
LRPPPKDRAATPQPPGAVSTNVGGTGRPSRACRNHERLWFRT